MSKRKSSPLVLVCGATGQTGAAVAKDLSEAGFSVRVLVRDPSAEKCAALKELVNVVLFKGDYLDKDSLKEACKGVDRVFLTCSNSPKQKEMECNVIDAAKDCGVSYLVKNSTCAEACYAHSPVCYGIWHWEIEEHLAKSGIKYTVLYPTWMMGNMKFFLGKSVKTENKFVLPYAENEKVSMIDQRDVGKAGAALLSMDDQDIRTHHRFYKLTGPEAISFTEIAEILGNLVERKIEYNIETMEEFQQRITDMKFPDWLVGALTNITKICKSQSYVSKDFEYITGKQPTTVTQFFQDNLAVFK